LYKAQIDDVKAGHNHGILFYFLDFEFPSKQALLEEEGVLTVDNLIQKAKNNGNFISLAFSKQNLQI
jgi:hypothetical protein